MIHHQFFVRTTCRLPDEKMDVNKQRADEINHPLFVRYCSCFVIFFVIS